MNIMADPSQALEGKENIFKCFKVAGVVRLGV
ncbi:hypothetical protein CCACVL1_24463 [Corchorus capsularis]|uniref:Uncharacterized protein n=1 Tax=Corchorus capsularis TaxID=210143 RepID=A0A1R3GPH4_COCAP|nr:hypothetical protein CCACVL1_24463 [Corchorus capsularis]